MSNDARKLLTSYCTGVEHPEAHGLEHDHMLHVRDGLYELADELAPDEKQALESADRRLAEQAPAFVAALAQVVDLEQRRREKRIPPQRWWWYLDVLPHIPSSQPADAPQKPTRSAHSAAS